MSIDFTLPKKEQAYDGGVLATIRSNQLAIASLLDGVSITGGAVAGLKRYNAGSTLFEKFDGTSWSEMQLAYLKLTGGTLTGALTLAGNATQNLHPVTLQQMNAALSGTATSGALANYAQLSGASFSGSISTAGTLAVNGSAMFSNGITVAGNVSATGVLYAGQGTLSTPNQFMLTAAGSTLPTLQWDVGDSLTYDRASNQLNFNIGVATPVRLTNASFAIVGPRFVVQNDGGSGTGGLVQFCNMSGAGPNFRTNSTGGLDIFNSAFALANFSLDDATGNVVTRGLLFGRGGGAGLGQITDQNGGGPSGGASGDIFFIY